MPRQVSDGAVRLHPHLGFARRGDGTVGQLAIQFRVRRPPPLAAAAAAAAASEKEPEPKPEARRGGAEFYPALRYGIPGGVGARRCADAVFAKGVEVIKGQKSHWHAEHVAERAAHAKSIEEAKAAKKQADDEHTAVLESVRTDLTSRLEAEQAAHEAEQAAHAKTVEEATAAKKQADDEHTAALESVRTDLTSRLEAEQAAHEAEQAAHAKTVEEATAAKKQADDEHTAALESVRTDLISRLEAEQAAHAKTVEEATAAKKQADDEHTAALEAYTETVESLMRQLSAEAKEQEETRMEVSASSLDQERADHLNIQRREQPDDPRGARPSGIDANAGVSRQVQRDAFREAVIEDLLRRIPSAVREAVNSVEVYCPVPDAGGKVVAESPRVDASVAEGTPPAAMDPAPQWIRGGAGGEAQPVRASRRCRCSRYHLRAISTSS
eukprot:COSAG01_NODE_15_length_40797_cov_245.690550_8_plen_441_part_00